MNMIFHGFWAGMLRERIFDCFKDVNGINNNLQVIGEQLKNMNEQLANLNEKIEMEVRSNESSSDSEP